jgi:hypothetical protein
MEVDYEQMEVRYKGSRWVEKIFHKSDLLRLSVTSDYIADTFASAGVVLLAAAVTDNRAPAYLADFTALPIAFVCKVLSLMDELEMWDSKHYDKLLGTLEELPYDLSISECCLFNTPDEFWDEAPLTSIDVALGILRRGIVPGGTQRPPSKEAWYELWRKLSGTSPTEAV